ncbi:hypothetical protein [Rhodococcus sp. WAY2]|nr:hypothetical protein [Rhodococcus sp. WAY2]QHE74352.1 hypothetical protein GFS60_08051 [Rhodococcus sp. WAY2]
MSPLRVVPALLLAAGLTALADSAAAAAMTAMMPGLRPSVHAQR